MTGPRDTYTLGCDMPGCVTRLSPQLMLQFVVETDDGTPFRATACTPAHREQVRSAWAHARFDKPDDPPQLAFV